MAVLPNVPPILDQLSLLGYLRSHERVPWPSARWRSSVCSNNPRRRRIFQRVDDW